MLYMKYIAKIFLVIIIAVVISPTVNAQYAEKADIYRLGAGDKLRITVFGEPDLSGTFVVDGTGVISLPLIGEVMVQNLSLREVEGKVARKFADGYLVSPRISIEVLNFRPFFILGEVNSPGSYPFVNALTVLNAVALAGGYTPRARKENVTIRRTVGGEVREIEAQEGDRVMPGDVLRVHERFF